MPRTSGGGQSGGRNGENRSSGSGKSERGLASSSERTKKEVARKGGEASKGGGRSSVGGGRSGGRNSE